MNCKAMAIVTCQSQSPARPSMKAVACYSRQMGCTWSVVQGSSAFDDNFRPIHCHHRNIEKDRQRGEKAASDVKNKAKAMAVALQTIGKFVVKKKVGENDKIFGRCELVYVSMPHCATCQHCKRCNIIQVIKFEAAWSFLLDCSDLTA